MRWVRSEFWTWKAAAVLCLLAGSQPVVAEQTGAGNAAAHPAIQHTQPPPTVIERLLAVQNAERIKLGLEPLTWNAELANDASVWAKILLEKGALQHAPKKHRKGAGENLWMGTAGAFDTDAMIGMFLEERRYFRSAPFPDVSLTGNWSDVGHYTQIVWKGTKKVGCALDTGNGMDVLVCRYSPAGNVFGEMPF